MSLGATQRRSEGPVERTVTEYERPRPNIHKLMYIFGSVCGIEQLGSDTKRDYSIVMIMQNRK